MASTKEAILAKEHMPEVDCVIFYMDMRAFGKGYQEFYERAQREFGIKYIKSRPAKIDEDPKTKNLIITYEDVTTSEYRKMEVDMVVLAVGIRPISLEKFFPVEADGFARKKDPFLDPVASPMEGIYVIGMIGGPKDIPDSVTEASAAAMRAAVWAVRG
jgi:heterodisulfide reductase subunit A